MTFSLYGLLTDQSPPFSNESLADKLKAYFREDEKFTLSFEQLPFKKDKTLAIRWDDWLVRASYEEGEAVRNDSIEIQQRTKEFSVTDVSDVDRRIRMVFGSDNEKAYTNEIIYLMQFLGEIDGIVIYDPQQNDFLPSDL
ncbi:hypothetical protein ASD15_31420 [Massilia sp. Root351]|jgi:hypothetical protein|uniref:hypothetical protein n=1 Tax=Massilia sp. Root351 TaxID=1736522 RepID=UPI00070F1AD0|nr:hypothetical protein [Massilia sp. Root351]KQV81846.1 hypothetical protein ASD15_31420 [Massilia sp. Root351]